MKELHTTLDGRHWILDESKRTTRRSHPPVGSSKPSGKEHSRRPHPPGTSGTEHSRAPSKPRPSPRFVTSPSLPARVLFPAGGPSDSVDTSPASSPSDSYTNPALCREPADSDSDIGDTIVLGSRPPSQLSAAPDRSFLDDFVPHGFTGSELLAGSSAVLQTTASALNTTASVVRNMFAPTSDSRPPVTGDAPTRGDDAPRTREDGQNRPRDRNPPPTWEQFAEIQRKYAVLQQQMDEILARNSTDERARTIDEEIEARRKAAYESAGLAYTARQRQPSTPSSNDSHFAPQHGGRVMEYRISHKSIGYLRPAEASNKPFEAVDGEIYVRPLAWLAHLRTKLELKDDFNYRNQVLQVASECLVGRAAAWWTAIGQRMRNILLTDYTLEQWHLQMQVLCQSREQTKKEAIARTWRVDKEECWDYVWAKAALFEELELRDRPTGTALISEILDGLPSSLARMCRTEFSPNPTVSDLTRELQVLVPRWRRDVLLHDRPRRPGNRPAEVQVADRAPADRPPLSSSYDRTKIGSQLHPLTKKLTRCYTKPNGKIIFLSRNCSRCHEAHFDFEHDSLKPSAHFTLDESGYEEWDWDSDTDTVDDDLITKKLN